MWLPLLMNAAMLLVVFDAALWSFVLLRHSFWLRKHPIKDSSCERISWIMLAIAATMTGVFVLSLGVVWVWVKVFYGYYTALFVVMFCMNLSIIHLYALIAHCTMLDIEYWPAQSKGIALYIILPIRLQNAKLRRRSANRRKL